MTLTNAEIVARFKALANYSLRANDGSTTTLVANKLIDIRDVTGFYLCFTSGDNYGVDKVVSSFDEVTGTLTFDALGTTVLNTDEVCLLEDGFATEIKQAEIFIINHLRNKGLDIDLFLTIAQLKEAHIYKTLELVCLNFSKDATDDDIFYVASQNFGNLYTSELGSLVADYDENEDGQISEDEEDVQIGQVSFTR